MLTDEAAVLERHAVGTDELKVGDAAASVGRGRAGFSEAFAVEAGQSHEPVATFRGDLVGASSDRKNCRSSVLVEGDQRGDPARHPGVAGRAIDISPATGPGASLPW